MMIRIAVRNPNPDSRRRYVRREFKAHSIVGCVAIHRPIDIKRLKLGEGYHPSRQRNAGYVVTHVSSGRRLRSFDTLAGAKAYALAFNRIPDVSRIRSNGASPASLRKLFGRIEVQRSTMRHDDMREAEAINAVLANLASEGERY